MSCCSAAQKNIYKKLSSKLFFSADVLDEYEYRKVYATGVYRHDQEILLGPRTRGDGNAGYFVITPFERDNGTTILVKRGWISPDKKDQKTRPESLEQGPVEVVGLIRVNEEVRVFTCLEER